MSEIIIYTDGGSRGNGSEDSVGGWGVILSYKGYVKELYEGERNATNNQMELKGVINGLKALKTTDVPVRLHCDSAYVVNGINKWVAGWKRNRWTKKGGEIKNLELWKELDRLVTMQLDLEIIKVKAHVGIELNERADELANLAMDKESAI